jgi:site-specific recombinase XerD
MSGHFALPSPAAIYSQAHLPEDRFMARSAKPWYRKDRKSWFVTIAGVRHNLGPDKAEAFKQFHTMMREPTRKQVKGRSFVAVADAFLEWLKRHRAADTFEWYRYRLERFCRYHPDLSAEDLKPLHVQEWVDRYPDLSKTSRRNYLRSMKRCVAWACRQGYMESDPIQGMEVPVADRREVFVTPAEFEELITFMPDVSFRDLCRFTFETGARPQESLIAEARHFDSVRSRLVFSVKESKGRKQPRVVYLSPFAESVTRALAEKYPTGTLFRNRDGLKWTTDAVNCAFARLRIRMGVAKMVEQGVSLNEAIMQELKRRGDKRSLDDLTPKERPKIVNCAKAHFAPKYCLYSLRHGFATTALQSGLDGLTVGILLGHNDPSTMAKVYQHLAHNAEHLLGQLRKTVQQ